MDGLIFDVNEIPDGGCHLAKEVSPGEIGIEDSDCQVQGRLSVALQLYPTENGVSVQGSISGVVLYQCVRCLVEFDQSFELPFSGIFQESLVPHPNEEKDEDESLDDMEFIDSYPMAEGTMDVAQLIREQMVLMVPMNPICHADCLGLCPICGQDRNQQNCGCHEMSVTSPFACLQQLKIPEFQSRA